MASVNYEWDYETVDPDTGEVVDHDHRDKLRDYTYPLDTYQVLVLVRDDEDSGRQWAYVTGDGVLPEFFEVPEGDGNYYATNVKVPQRFHKELAVYARTA